MTDALGDGLLIARNTLFLGREGRGGGVGETGCHSGLPEMSGAKAGDKIEKQRKIWRDDINQGLMEYSQLEEDWVDALDLLFSPNVIDWRQTENESYCPSWSALGMYENFISIMK